jgi:hypothetical protein
VKLTEAEAVSLFSRLQEVRIQQALSGLWKKLLLSFKSTEIDKDEIPHSARDLIVLMPLWLEINYIFNSKYIIKFIFIRH